MKKTRITSCPELMEAIDEIGLVPLLNSGIPGFSADELVAPTWNVYNIVDRNDPHYGWYRVEVIGFLARFEEWNGQKSVLENKVEHSPSTH